MEVPRWYFHGLGYKRSCYGNSIRERVLQLHGCMNPFCARKTKTACDERSAKKISVHAEEFAVIRLFRVQARRQQLAKEGVKPVGKLSKRSATIGWREVCSVQENCGRKCLPDRWKWHFPGFPEKAWDSQKEIQKRSARHITTQEELRWPSGEFKEEQCLEQPQPWSYKVAWFLPRGADEVFFSFSSSLRKAQGGGSHRGTTQTTWFPS
ncbi:hypothetical protein HOLleu_17421 [Holothuria leucospilota]|uniref:Uncharacterized protein n=1 Tax=Holothuria leucospilota TaxID=206669 RepID=A0A9Q1C239_HOLLE|nr:hypothetical protein HOLleu_17421 [Holothuria leucospilota]